MINPQTQFYGAEVISSPRSVDDALLDVTIQHVYNYFFGMTKSDLRSIGRVWKQRTTGSKLTQVYRMFRFVKNGVSLGQDAVQIIKENKFCKDIFDYMQQKREKEPYIQAPHTADIDFELEKHGDPVGEIISSSRTAADRLGRQN